MKKNLVSYLLLMTCIFSITNSSAQGWKELPILVKGKFITNQASNRDSLSIVTYTDFMIFGQKEFKIPIDSNMQFELKLEKLKHPALVWIFAPGSKSMLLFNQTVEPGESIFLAAEVINGKLKTEMKSNLMKKYVCLDSLKAENSRFNIRNTANNRTLRGLVNIESDFNKIHQFIATGFDDLMKVLDSYKSEITAETYQDYKAMYIHFYFSLWEAEISSALAKAKDQNSRDRLLKIYQQSRFSNDTINPVTAAFNEFSIQHLLEKSRTTMLLNSNGKGYKYSAIFNYLKTEYSGQIRDRLLCYFLLDIKSTTDVINYSAHEFDNCLSNALHIIKEPFLVQELKNRIIFMKGTPVQDFTMPDTAGKMVSLHDFKGKVVLIDIWGEGCSGCALFARMVKDHIWPMFKDEPNFELISISVDRSRERWLKGIHSGKYTEPYHVNLFTDGKALEHPFTKQYLINTLPFMLLIDKRGNIFSKVELSLKYEEVMKLITAALTENYNSSVQPVGN